MISIVVPVYNVEKYIKETIESVLAQTYKDWELILVNDCSTDGTLLQIAEFGDLRIRVIRLTENVGAYAARNKGVEAARGRYIAFLDADDLWEPEKLEHELAFMERENAGFVFTGYEFANEKGEGTGAVVRVPHTVDFKQALYNTNIFTSTVLIDQEKIDHKLIIMPNIKSEDTATWWTILKAGNLAYGLNENLVKYRRSSGSLSSNKLEALKRIWRLYREIAKLSVPSACLHFICWAFTAVLRRL